MAGKVRIEPQDPHQVLVRIDGLDGYIRYWVPECINVNDPGYDPSGVHMYYGTPGMRRLNRSDIVRSLEPQLKENEPLLWTRGPITQLKMDTADEKTEWSCKDDRHIEMSITKPGVFEYQSSIAANEDSVSVEATLKNTSSWDWREAYVYHCCGVDPAPAFIDRSGQRTVILTAQGLIRLTETERITRPDFRTTAQYYEPQGKPIPRTEDGFSFDECGINEKQVVAGLVLRQSNDSQYVLATVSRRYRSIFVDLGGQNNCLHTNPLAGDLVTGETASVNGSIHLMQSDFKNAIRQLADECQIPIVSPEGMNRIL